MDLQGLTITSFAEGLRKKKFSAREVTEAHLGAIQEKDAELGAYLDVYEKEAPARAEAVDHALAKGESLHHLAGVPLALKDNILIKGHRATAGSKVLEHYTASYDAGVVLKLKETHAVFLGKTNLDEFAMGSSTEHSAFRQTKNPHDLERVPGGSSGGSAAAVAAGMALGAFGSDTFGSIRQPAGFCGVVGLKPTYGAVSRAGLIGMTSSCDQIGPLANTVEDAALLFHAIAGHDPMDATSAEHSYETLLESNFDAVKKLTVGIPKEYFVEGLEKEVQEAMEQVTTALKKLGFAFKDVSLPHTRYAVPCYYTIMPGEVSSNLARYDGIRYARIPGVEEHVSKNEDTYVRQRGAGFGPETKRRVILGTFVLSAGYHDAYYKKAQAVRALIARDFEEAFKEVDVLLTPVSPTTAFNIGEKVNDPVSMYLSDIFTGPVNLAGLPAISIPAPREPGALPVGFQLIGRHFREADILGVGRMYEEAVR